MGLLLDARCPGCGYARPGLRLGATHAQIDTHDISHFEVFAAACCRELQSVQVFLGQPLPSPPCERCGQALGLAPERRYRISTMKGEVLQGHRCVRCEQPTLGFEPAGTFL